MEGKRRGEGGVRRHPSPLCRECQVSTSSSEKLLAYVCGRARRKEDNGAGSSTRTPHSRLPSPSAAASAPPMRRASALASGTVDSRCRPACIMPGISV